MSPRGPRSPCGWPAARFIGSDRCFYAAYPLLLAVFLTAFLTSTVPDLRSCRFTSIPPGVVDCSLQCFSGLPAAALTFGHVRSPPFLLAGISGRRAGPGAPFLIAVWRLWSTSTVLGLRSCVLTPSWELASQQKQLCATMLEVVTGGRRYLEKDPSTPFSSRPTFLIEGNRKASSLAEANPRGTRHFLRFYNNLGKGQSNKKEAIVGDEGHPSGTPRGPETPPGTTVGAATGTAKTATGPAFPGFGGATGPGPPAGVDR